MSPEMVSLRKQLKLPAKVLPRKLSKLRAKASLRKSAVSMSRLPLLYPFL
jgi:hypothetical protein